MSLKKQLYIFLLFVLQNASIGQVIYTHQRTISSNFWSITNEYQSNNLLVTNNQISYNPDFACSKSQILKVSDSGVLLDSLNFSSAYFLPAPILKHKGFYYCYGTKLKTYGAGSESYFSTVYKIDQNLQIVGEKIIDTTYNDFIAYNKVIALNNKIYLANEHLTSGYFYLYTLDLNLNKLDSLKTQGMFLSDLNIVDNRLLLSGFGLPSMPPNGMDYVTELDTLYSVISRKGIANLGTQTTVCGSQNISLLANTANVVPLRNKKYSLIGYYPVNSIATCSLFSKNVISIVKDNSLVLNTKLTGVDGVHNVQTLSSASSVFKNNFIYSIAMSGYVPNNPYPPQTNTTQILILKADTNGNVIWTKYFNSSNYYYNPYGINVTPDTTLFISGMRYNISTPVVAGSCEGFILKLDKNGNEIPTGFGLNNFFHKDGFKCFPNPINSKINFELKEFKSCSIRIFDCAGKEIKHAEFKNNLLEIDLSNFESGFYTYVLLGEKNNFSGKFIKN